MFSGKHMLLYMNGTRSENSMLRTFFKRSEGKCKKFRCFTISLKNICSLKNKINDKNIKNISSLKNQINDKNADFYHLSRMDFFFPEIRGHWTYELALKAENQEKVPKCIPWAGSMDVICLRWTKI